MACFSSFHGTPILLLTEPVRAGLPVSAGAALPAILRDAWLGRTWQDGWFVGPYWILPDRVSLFACAGSVACTPGVWTARWKATAASRIRALTCSGQVEWTGGHPPVPVASEPDYRAALEAMAAEAARVAGGVDRAGASGMLWQLL
jgi:hypothetical protein